MVDEPRNSLAERIEQRRASGCLQPEHWREECDRAIDAVKEKLEQSTEPMAIAIAFGPRGNIANGDKFFSAPELPSAPAAIYPPIPMLLWCPECKARHVDKGEFATTKHHHTHACQHCGHCWRPAIVSTVGVQFLPGFKDED